jgi:hypothetical protein
MGSDVGLGFGVFVGAVVGGASASATDSASAGVSCVAEEQAAKTKTNSTSRVIEIMFLFIVLL